MGGGLRAAQAGESETDFNHRLGIVESDRTAAFGIGVGRGNFLRAIKITGKTPRGNLDDVVALDVERGGSRSAQGGPARRAAQF